jgi:hypothetical protein
MANSYRDVFEIPEPVGKRVLGWGDAQWNRFVALRVIEVRVSEETGRQYTNISSLERANARSHQQRQPARERA